MALMVLKRSSRICHLSVKNYAIEHQRINNQKYFPATILLPYWLYLNVHYIPMKWFLESLVHEYAPFIRE